MTAPLELEDGDAAAPALSFDSDTDTGIYLKAANELGLAAAGAEVVAVTAAGIDVTGAVSGDSGTLSGNLALTGANPAVTTGFADTLTPTNIPKAWGCITKSGAGAIALTSGFNVASVAYSAGTVLVTFATAMADTNFAIMLTTNKEGGFLYAGGTKTTSTFNFVASVLSGTPINLDTNGTAWIFYFVVFGAQ